ncbi:MAG: hypothetical protein GWN54_00270 [Gammaproteobacteria bacterium]|nr:hypothetical protein [Gammaproteobacteria bacterium]
MAGKSFREFRDLYATLDPPESPEGVWRGKPVGPGWFVKLAGPGLALGGLGGWWGKDFDGQGGIDNLLERDGALRRTLPGKVREAASLLDGKPCQRIEYPKGSRLPWIWAVDELRQVGEGKLLGMMVLNVRGLPHLAFPFTLRAREDVEGLE